MLGSYGVVNDVFVVPINLNVLGVDAAEFVPEQFRLLLRCSADSSVVLNECPSAEEFEPFPTMFLTKLHIFGWSVGPRLETKVVQACRFADIMSFLFLLQLSSTPSV